MTQPQRESSLSSALDHERLAASSDDVIAEHARWALEQLCPHK